MSWRSDAACKGFPTEWWFPERRPTKQTQQAVAICETCIVAAECLHDALRYEEFGVWAGTSKEARDKFRVRAY
jgi:WhiB family redox-sensing transcriptional regulator